MATLYASVGLGGAGYLAVQDYGSTLSEGVGQVEGCDKPSMNSIYESKYYPETKATEFTKGDAMWQQSQNPLETGVVPRPAYASMFAPINEKLDDKTNTNDNNNNDMTHNNMQPFFGGSVKQNMRHDINETRLESFTGQISGFKSKRETETLFKPTSDFTNINGMRPYSQVIENRISDPVLRNNDLPFEPMRVGPGLNQGFTNMPSGGFQQAGTADIIRPKCVDELRVLTNPKTSYKIPVAASSKSLVDAPTSMPILAKNRTEKEFEQSADQWLTTTGSQIKEAGRPKLVIRPTSRVDTHIDYVPNASLSSTQQQMDNDDYGKGAYGDANGRYTNERDLTVGKPTNSTITSIVKAITAPFVDIVRHNIREFFVDSARTFGQLQATGSVPEKPTLYDASEHVMRTTIKETTIHDNINGNLTTNVPDNYMAGDDIARTTIKETTIHDGVIGNLTTPTKTTYKAKEDDDKAKTTVRETTPLMTTTLNVSSHVYAATVYNADEVARTTIRETTEQTKENGFISVTNKDGAYSFIRVEVDPTQRQFIEDHDYIPAPDSKDKAPPSYEASQQFNNSFSRDVLGVEAGSRVPTSRGPTTAVAKDGVNLQTTKLNIDAASARSTVGPVNGTFKQTPIAPTQCNTARNSSHKNNDEKKQDDRLDGSLLTPFYSNPFTKPLTSSA